MSKVIDVEDTPNPDALKFVLDETLLSTGVRQFESAQAAKPDALASALFAIPGVQSVFYMGKFVTVSKDSGVKWSHIQPKINQAISENGRSSDGRSSDGPSSDDQTTGGHSTKPTVTSTDDEMLKRINTVLDESVKPALAGDGGGLEVLSLNGFVLTVHYQGACGSCPSSSAGTLVAVQNLLQRLVDPRLVVVSD